jgi:hypothetical protein
MREWRYSSIILDLGTRWRRMVSFTPLPLNPRGKGSRYPLDRRPARPQSRSGHCGEEKNLLSLPGIVPRVLGRPANSLVAKPTELSQDNKSGGSKCNILNTNKNGVKETEYEDTDCIRLAQDRNMERAW